MVRISGPFKILQVQIEKVALRIDLCEVSEDLA